MGQKEAFSILSHGDMEDMAVADGARRSVLPILSRGDMAADGGDGARRSVQLILSHGDMEDMAVADGARRSVQPILSHGDTEDMAVVDGARRGVQPILSHGEDMAVVDTEDGVAKLCLEKRQR